MFCRWDWSPFLQALAIVLAGALTVPAPVRAAGQQEPAAADSLHIEVLEGNGAINNIAVKRGRDPVVKVVAPDGSPASGAVVTFVLPTTGPGANFANGSRTLSIPAGSDGVATAQGLQPNGVEGQYEIRVSATWEGKLARAVVTQTNVRPVEKSSNATKALLIVGIIAGAAAGAAVALSGGKTTSSGSQTPAPGTGSPTTISAGSPTFGPP